jgi:hypothetical protein
MLIGSLASLPPTSPTRTLLVQDQVLDSALAPVSVLEVPRTRTLALNILPYAPHSTPRSTLLTTRSTTETLMDLEDPDSTRPDTSTKTPTSTSLPVPADPLLVELPTPTSSTPTDPELLETHTVLPTATPTSRRLRAGRAPEVSRDSYVLKPIF